MSRVLNAKGFTLAAACGALVLAAPVWAQDDGVDEDFLRTPSQTAVTPDDPVDPSFDRRSNERSNGLSNDWIRDDTNRTAASDPLPTRKEPPEERGLERARERADEHAEDGLDRATERVDDNEPDPMPERADDNPLDRTERERDRPGFDNRSTRAADAQERDDAEE